MAKKVEQSIWGTELGEIQMVKINSVVMNAKNPRIIRDAKFNKLVSSLKDFPEMANIRPLVVDEGMVILGGNMRFKAMSYAGLKMVPIIIMRGLSPEQKEEFIVKDNAHFGEWDWDFLANNFDEVELGGWGLDVWQPTDLYEPIGQSDDFDDDPIPSSDPTESGEKIKKKVIQIEFMLGDYSEAFDLVNALKSKKINIGNILIASMTKQLQNEN